MTDFQELMSVWMLLDALAIGATVFVLRASYRRLRDPAIAGRPFALEGDESDAMTHFIAIDLTRRNNHRIPDETPQFLYSTRFDYPAFFHKIMSYLPRRWVERGEWLVSPGFEGMHAALIYLGAVLLLSHLQSAEHVRPLALLVAAGWAVTPLLTYNPRRGSYIGERCFGYIFGHAFLFCTAMATAWDEPLWIIPAALAFTVGTSASKFTFQATTFTTLIFSVLCLDVMPLVVLAASAAAAVVLSRGYVLRVLAGTIRHSRFYRSFLVHVHDYTSAFSTRDLMQGLRLAAGGQLRNAIASFRRHPIHRLPSLVPWLLPFLAFALSESSRDVSPVAPVLIAWVLAALIVCLLTATDTLKFLGEAERYMEFALLPLITLSVSAPLPAGPTLLFLVFAYSLFRLGQVYIAPGRPAIAPPERIELLRWMEAQPPSTILAVPGRLCFPLLYGTAHRAAWWFTNAPYGERLVTLKSLLEGAVYPYIAPAALERAQSLCGADMIVINKDGAAGAAQHWGLRYDWSNHSVLFENEKFVVVDARARGQGRAQDDGSATAPAPYARLA